MIDLTIDNLLQQLKSLGYEANLQKETNQIYIILKVAESDFPVFFKIASEGELLQVLVFMPGTLQDGTEGEVGRILHYINKELDIPGFGMDEAAKVIFYRIMLPAKDKKIDEKLLKTYLGIVEPVCETFAPAIMTVATGNLTFNKVLEKLKEASNANT